MKRKIAAILAADVFGYSKLVAEDEEETLRRLASYRAVFDDFITRCSGRVFNTAGDAILAEFPSAVEAVRCAIDVQESLRTRNLAYPASRQMTFRIGISIGDVVDRQHGFSVRRTIHVAQAIDDDLGAVNSHPIAFPVAILRDAARKSAHPSCREQCRTCSESRDCYSQGGALSRRRPGAIPVCPRALWPC